MIQALGFRFIICKTLFIAYNNITFVRIKSQEK